LLVDLVGENRVAIIASNIVVGKEGEDIFIWKPNIDGNFSSSSAWEIIQIKGELVPWMDWIWPNSIPKKIYVCI